MGRDLEVDFGNNPLNRSSKSFLTVRCLSYVVDPELRRLLWFLLGGKRGGENRARIIQTLRVRPRNLNQLSKDLNLQYKAIQHHVQVLLNSSLLVPSGEGYGTVYLLSPWLRHHIEIFDEVCTSIGIKVNLLKGEMSELGQ